MASYNHVTLAGNLTRDVELKHTPSGVAIADIGLAVNDRRKKDDEWIDEVSFFNCTAFGRTAEVASEYLAKGSPLLIGGRLKQESWEKDGQKKSAVKIIIDKLQMLGSKDDSPSGGSSPATAKGKKFDNVPDDDAPF